MKNSAYSLKRWIFLFFFLIFVVALGSVIVDNREKTQGDAFVVFTFVINIILFVWQLVLAVKKHAFGLDFMFWFFQLFFFGYAPLLQYFTGTSMWGINQTADEIVLANFHILIWSTCYLLGRTFFLVPTKKAIKKNETRQLSRELYIRTDVLNILVFISVLITMYFLGTIGFRNMLFRSTNVNEDLNTMQSLLSDHILKNTVVFTFALSAVLTLQTKKLNLGVLISGMCFLLCCFPTGISRNMMAGFYGGLVIITLFKQISKGRWFAGAIIMSLVILFPAMDVFRNFDDFQRGNGMQLFLREIERTYITGDYDAYSILIAITRYVKQFGCSYGKQLLGVAFFFVPRSIWPAKPEGTGHTIAKKFLSNDFTNVSCPLVAEGYINFGLVGVVIFAILTGIICRKMDEKYWETANELSYIRIIYPICIFQFFFLLRGDMMSGGAYLIGRIVVGFLVCGIVVGQKKSSANKYKGKYLKSGVKHDS